MGGASSRGSLLHTVKHGPTCPLKTEERNRSVRLAPVPLNPGVSGSQVVLYHFGFRRITSRGNPLVYTPTTWQRAICV